MTASKRYIIPIFVIVFILLAIFTLDQLYFGLPPIPAPEDSRAQPILEIIPISLPSGARIAAEVAWTDRQKAKGLMFRSVVPPGTGMLLVHKEQDYHQIWMKNTFVDLDLIFINENKQIVSLAKNVPASKTDTPESDLARKTGYCRYVLEMKAGEIDRLKLSKGLQLDFKFTGK